MCPKPICLQQQPSSTLCTETISPSVSHRAHRRPCRLVEQYLILSNTISNFPLSSPSHIPDVESLYPILQSPFSSRPSAGIHSIRPVTGNLSRISRSTANKDLPEKKDCSSFMTNGATRSKNIPRPSTMPQSPSVQDIELLSDPNAEYAIVISMYEVYNDRIFDLLTGSATKKNANVKRRALLFKSTEQSPDRKVVAGLTKIICGSFEEALMVLETGLTERKVAGTGSNAVSSRSHGFFCLEVKKRDAERKGPWSSSTLTIVDLAGSERARNAKTAGATLAEAGKINESLMYLGQCMQMQSDNQDGSKVRTHPSAHILLNITDHHRTLCHSANANSPSSFSPTRFHLPMRDILIITIHRSQS